MACNLFCAVKAFVCFIEFALRFTSWWHRIPVSFSYCALVCGGIVLFLSSWDVSRTVGVGTTISFEFIQAHLGRALEVCVVLPLWIIVSCSSVSCYVMFLRCSVVILLMHFLHKSVVCSVVYVTRRKWTWLLLHRNFKMWGKEKIVKQCVAREGRWTCTVFKHFLK